MEEARLAFLQRLLDAPGPSGYEQAPARVWREEASTFADDVTHDVVGNSYARISPRQGIANAPRVILAGHIDEIGFVITHIDPEGYLWIEPLGGWDAEVIVGQRLRISAKPASNGKPALAQLDFLRLKPGSRLRVNVPVHFVNQEASPGLKRGGALNIVFHTVEMWVPADNIPEAVTADLTGMDFNDSLHISAIPLPEGCRPTNPDKNFTVASLTPPAGGGEEAPAPAAAPAAAPAKEEKKK